MHLLHSMARRYLVVLLCLLPWLAAAQHANPGTLYLTKDSLAYNIDEPWWRFTAIDLPAGADTALDDSRWPLVSSGLYVRHDTVAHGFKGIGWFRLHFVTDGSLSARTLAFRLKQTGASEIYLDGRLQRSYGRLTPADSAEYIYPQSESLILPTINAGPHLLAVRYANWEYLRNKHRYGKTNAGFTAAIWEANAAVASTAEQQAVLLCCFMLLFGIFITLSLVHLILYLYYRADRANARFSLFAACVSMLFLLPAIMRLSDDALLIMKLGNVVLWVIAAVTFSLSLLLNGLFSRRKWHFYLVAAACLSIVLLLVFKRSYAVFGLICVCVLVAIETLYILVSALWRRMPGARIIGGGLMLLAGLLLAVLVIVLIQGDININENTLAGQVFVLTLILAILSIPISMSMYLAWRFSAVSRNLKAQLQEVEALSAHAREQEAEKQRLLESRQEELEREVATRTGEVRRQHEDLKIEKKKSDDLLLNILPEEVAEELKEKGSAAARLYDNVSVLFTDFADFTQISESLSPAALVAELHECFTAFDDIIGKHGLEKIKTVGDAYIAVSGLPSANERHAQDVVRAALDIRAWVEARRYAHAHTFSVRLGVHSGPVVAGIVGLKKFAYDIWGDTVNTAARMEQHSDPGKLNISAATYALVKDDFTCAYRGEIAAKHKGKMGMYFVD